MFAGGSSSSSSSAVSSAIKQSMDKKSLFRVLAVGDVMLGRLVDGLFPTHNDDPEHAGHAKRYLKAVSGGPERLAQYKKQQYKFVWGDTLPLFQEADVRVINLETSVTTHDVKNPKTFNYRMHPANLRALHEAHVDYCSLANNHTLDYCEEGLFDTIKHMNKSGIKWAGAGRNLSEARAPAIISCQDRKIAFFSFSDHPKDWAASENKPGINYLDIYNYTKEDINMIKQLIQDTDKRERDKDGKGLNMVVASLHWGPNYLWVPEPQFESFAHDLIDVCGVDMIHGHSSHHIQGIEIYKGKPILYGCGDFVDDYAIDPEYRNDLGFCYFCNFHWGKHDSPRHVEGSKEAEREEVPVVDHLRLVPTKIKLFSVTATSIPEKDKKWLETHMSSLCAKYRTKVEVKEDGSLILTSTPST
ncbi:Polyglutamate biosynthesis protein [Balamuthia mandrillaris]